MHILFDNLTASLIASALFLLIVTVNTRTQQSLTESTTFHSMMRHGENFTQILRRDMQGVASPLSLEGDTSSAFRFWGMIGTSTTADSISYVPQKVDTMYFEDDAGVTVAVPIFRIIRYVNGVEVGGSSDIIVDWKVKCFNANGLASSDTDECKRITVDLVAAPRIGVAGTVPRMNWGTTFFPPLLQ